MFFLAKASWIYEYEINIVIQEEKYFFIFV